jgi:hypothetical protein
VFDDQDREYFSRRAVDCRNKAEEATDPAIRAIHRELAEEYERRANGEPPRVTRRG